MNDELHVKMLEAVLRECDRSNISYQAVALESLGKILTTSDHKSKYFKDIYDKLRSIILKVKFRVTSGVFVVKMMTLVCFLFKGGG